ncbi:MAG: alpha/beta hydrolase, partial [Gammaproteobacteria bacterium]|nr:alpha/beta hydrolase [Gammaproteobacteria bacterium]
ILDIAPVVYSHTHAPHIDAMQNIDLASLKSRTDADVALKPDIPEAGIRQFLLQNLVYKNGMYSWRINLEVSLRATDDLIGFPELQNNPVYIHDTLFLYGGLSDYVQPASHQRIHELFPQAKFKTIENAGHWLHAEQPKLVSEMLRDFLK